MRCPQCKGSLSTYNFFREKLCPACGEKLKRMPSRAQIRETLISLAEDKGYIFWSIAYYFIIWIVSFFEQIFGKGVLFDYITDHWIRFFFIAVFSGSIIDYCVKANVEITAVRNKYIFRPPPFLRRFRNLTNFGVILGFGLSGYIIYRYPGYFNAIPIVTFITSFTVCFFWALMGIFLTEEDMVDKRINYYMFEMRVERVRKYNRASAFYIGGIFVAGITFYTLVRISGLWWYISNARFVYNFIKFFRDYFYWVHDFID